jgi:hypothetical protein
MPWTKLFWSSKLFGSHGLQPKANTATHCSTISPILHGILCLKINICQVSKATHGHTLQNLAQTGDMERGWERFLMVSLARILTSFQQWDGQGRAVGAMLPNWSEKTREILGGCTLRCGVDDHLPEVLLHVLKPVLGQSDHRAASYAQLQDRLWRNICKCAL